jgi:hypothetical protein
VETFRLEDGEQYERVNFVMMRGPRRLQVELQPVGAQTVH